MRTLTVQFQQERKLHEKAPKWIEETAVRWLLYPHERGIVDLSDRQLYVMPEAVFRMKKLHKLVLR